VLALLRATLTLRTTVPYAGSIFGDHQLAVGPLPERVGLYEPFELPDHPFGPPPGKSKTA
jgi:hypothetical protein